MCASRSPSATTKRRSGAILVPNRSFPFIASFYSHEGLMERRGREFPDRVRNRVVE
jgi:hypothetical protein